MSRPYDVPVSKWMTTPIVRGTNPLTGLIEGDDSGYRKVLTLPMNPAPLVIPDMQIRASYDGTDEYGNDRPEIALLGGLKDGVLVVRETAARGLEFLVDWVFRASDGEFSVVALDGFRSGKRQSAGFTRLLLPFLSEAGITDANHVDHLERFIEAGEKADGTFSWVNLTQGADYAAKVEQLKVDKAFMDQVEAIAAKKVIEHFDPALVDEVILTYLTISANSGIGHGVGLPLNFECNAHAGGGACDVFIMEVKTDRPINHVPFDYPGPEAGMDYLEQEGAYEAYLKVVAEKPQLTDHLRKLGYPTPEDFRLSDFKYFRGAIRLLYHASKALGCTYYSSDCGGENWHIEPGNRVYDPLSEDVLSQEFLTAASNTDSGNPGHALQKLGPKAVAVWGGNSGHLAARNWGLEM